MRVTHRNDLSILILLNKVKRKRVEIFAGIRRKEMRKDKDGQFAEALAAAQKAFDEKRYDDAVKYTEIEKMIFALS